MVALLTILSPCACPAAGVSPAPLTLDDRPEIFRPARLRTPEEQDRLDALAMFSAARIHQQREQSGEALRLYQRACRLDPQAGAIVRAIVSLAEELGRRDEAVRYAAKLEGRAVRNADPAVLRKLAIHLMEKNQWEESAAIYEKAIAAREDSPKNAADALLEMEAGRLHFLADQHAQAARRFDHVLEALAKPKQHGLDDEVVKLLLGQPAATYSTIGESYLMAGRLADAAAAFEKSQQAAANEGLYLYNMARIDLRTGKPKEALDRLQRYFEANLAGEGVAPYALLSETLAAMKKEAELVARLEKAKAADPENVPLGYYLADEYRKRKQYDLAEPLLRRLAAKTPTVTGYRGLVEIYAKTKKLNELLDVLAQAAARTSGLETLGEEGKAVTGDKEMVRLLLDSARKRLAADPKKFAYDHRVAAAMLAQEAKQHDTAGEFFERAVEARPDEKANLLLSWGLGLLMDEKYGPACKVFQRGLDEQAAPKDNPAFPYYLAAALEMDGKTDAALAAAREAARRQPDAPRLAGRVAWVLYHARRHDDAAKAYREVLTKSRDDYSSAEVRQLVRESRLALSNLCVLAENLDEAESLLEEVLDEFPDDPAPLNDLGYLWADAGKHLHRALRMVRRAVDAEPENAAYRDSLGWALFRIGSIAEALPQLEKAVALEPDPAVFDHLGDVYLAAGQADKAKDAWKQAAEAYRKEKLEDKAKAMEKKIVNCKL